MGNQKWILRSSLLALTSIMVACSGVAFNEMDLAKNDVGPIGTGKTAEESFYPNPHDSAPKVDILFVIDNSASMMSEQLKLGERLSSFVNSLRDVDWQIGITTTDTSTGVYGLRGSLVQLHGTNQYILNKNTPNYESVFANTVIRPEGVGCGNLCPSISERPIEAATLALGKGMVNGLIRQGAELAVVILSDADEGGSGIGTITTPQFFLSTAASLFNQQKRVTGYAIVVEPGDSACLEHRKKFTNYSYYGHNAALLATLTGGVTGSICDSNYSHSLKRIGDHVLNLVSSLTLSHYPVIESVRVTLSPQDPSVSWTIKNKSIEFNKPPKPGTRVDVRYEIGE